MTNIPKSRCSNISLSDKNRAPPDGPTAGGVAVALHTLFVLFDRYRLFSNYLRTDLPAIIPHQTLLQTGFSHHIPNRVDRCRLVGTGGYSNVPIPAVFARNHALPG